MHLIRNQKQFPRGRVERLEHRSSVLGGNPWGDPVERVLPVYLPPGYDRASDHYPVLWHLAGFTGAGPGLVNWKNFSESMPARLDRLIHEERIGPVIVAFPDCFTSLGGNQYLNTSAIGPYADYLLNELIPLLESKLRVMPGREHRAVFGKSSGGYGALYHGMRYASYWGAIASHAGDAGFDFCYRSHFGETLTTLGEYDARIEQFLLDFWQTQNVTGAQVEALMTIAMAASYDPDPSEALGFALPFDLKTGELDESRWSRWLAHDPVNMVEEYAESLKTLHGLFIDCGNHDQYHIQYGTRRLVDRLNALGVPHRYEEFDGTHSGIDHRLDVSLPYLYQKLMETT